MKITLLIDLDDTLLKNPMDSFIPRYFQLFGEYIKEYVDPSQFIDGILSGTDSMMENRDPSITLQEAFNNTFFAQIPLEEDGSEELITNFYNFDFPRLKEICHPMPGASQLIAEAKNRDYPIVVATNPIFPLNAIHQRIQWAELPIKLSELDLISSYESFRFTKPSSAYFAECLARLGWPNQPAVMIGNDPKNDIAGARALGLPTFLLNEDFKQIKMHDLRSAEGPLSLVFEWLDYLTIESLLPKFETQKSLIAILRGSLAALDHKIRSSEKPSEALFQQSERLSTLLKRISVLPEPDLDKKDIQPVFHEALLECGVMPK